MSRRIVILALDGVPCSLLRELAADGTMPHLADLLRRGSMRPMRSVLPTVSNCAWASFMTGTDPGAHGIYGFVDRRPDTWDLHVPTSRDRTGEALWERLSRLGRRVCVINVPGTYPPAPVNGVLVSCFLTPSVEKLSADPAVVAELKSLGYRIDVDTSLARHDREAFLADVRAVLDARSRALFRFLRKEPWDLFLCHVMSLDRLHHFLWEPFAAGDPVWRPRVLDVYRALDRTIGEAAAETPDDAEFLMLSDHGFCAVRHEVQVNRVFEEAGLLATRPGARGPALSNVDPARTRAYSILPGRIYVNLRGREPGGIVEPGRDAERVLRDAAARLLDLRDPSGAPVVEAVLRRDEAFHGPRTARAPDLVAKPYDGFDLKGAFGAGALFERTALCGMHAFGDAFLYVRGDEAPDGSDLSILDAHDVVLRRIGLTGR